MTEFDQAAFGTVLLHLRKQRRLSQETLSGLIGVSRGCYRMLEQGECQPSTKTLCRLAEVLRIPQEELMQMIREKAEEQSLTQPEKC